MTGIPSLAPCWTGFSGSPPVMAPRRRGRRPNGVESPPWLRTDVAVNDYDVVYFGVGDLTEASEKAIEAEVSALRGSRREA